MQTYTAVLNERIHLLAVQKLLYCVRSKRFLNAMSGDEFQRTVWPIDWTYHPFNCLKIIVMCNGYGVLRAFLISTLSKLEGKSPNPGRPTFAM
jgi:hypothetical protein